MSVNQPFGHEHRYWPATPPKVDLSVVIPAHNEEACIKALVERLNRVLETESVNFEIVIVDDGSTDQTWKSITELRVSQPQIHGLRLVRNFGHQNALLAGLFYAAGRAIVTMDSDLQHPPEVLPEMIRYWRDGHRIVNTRRVDAESAGRFKRAGSRNFYRIFSWLSGVSVKEGSSDFRLLDREVVDRLLQFHGGHDFLRGAVNWLGYAGPTVSFTSAKRFAGQSKYNFAKMAHFAANAVVSFSTKPLHLGIWLGLLLSAFSFIELTYALIVFIRGESLPGWASIITVMTFLFGFLFILLGIIGAYLSRIHRALQAPPRFIISETSHDHSDRLSAGAGVDFKTVP